MVTIDKLMRKFKFLHGAFFICTLFNDFVGIFVTQSLERFHSSYYFGIDNGLEGNFHLVIFFVKKVVFIVFEVFIT